MSYTKEIFRTHFERISLSVSLSHSSLISFFLFLSHTSTNKQKKWAFELFHLPHKKTYKRGTRVRIDPPFSSFCVAERKEREREREGKDNRERAHRGARESERERERERESRK